jgi:hypothetical protein
MAVFRSIFGRFPAVFFFFFFFFFFPPPPSPDTADSVTLMGVTLSRTAAVPSVVSLYWAVSISLVFLNKSVMKDSFPFPLFITWVQLVVALVMLFGLDRLREGRSVDAERVFVLFFVSMFLIWMSSRFSHHSMLLAFGFWFVFIVCLFSLCWHTYNVIASICISMADIMYVCVGSVLQLPWPAGLCPGAVVV